MRYTIFALVITATASLIAFETTHEVNAEPIQWPSFQPDLMPGASSSPYKARLPSNVSINDPDPQVGDKQNAYLGVWSGWMCRNKVTDLKIAVRVITSDGAKIAYAAGNANFKQYNEQLSAKFKREAFIATFQRGDTLTLQMRADGHLNVRFDGYDGDFWCTGVLSRTTLE